MFGSAGVFLALAAVSYVLAGCVLAIENEPRDDAEALLLVIGWPLKLRRK